MIKMAREWKKYSPEEMDQFKKDLIDFNLFKNMDFEQRAELYLHYEKQFGAKGLAELWGATASRMYNIKSQLKAKGLISEDESRKRKKETAKKTRKKKAAVKVKPEIVDEVKGLILSPEVKEEQMNLPLSEVVDYSHYSTPFSPMATHDQIQLLNPSGDHLRVSMEEFMKMLEIQGKMARMMEEQSFQKYMDGFHYKLNGEFTAQELKKRLEKILLIIEDEPNKYQIKFEIQEIEANHQENPQPDQQLSKEVNELQEKLLEMQEELKKREEAEKYLAKSYELFQNKQQGLHHPRSEFEKKSEVKGTYERDGKTFYQLYYICECSHKGKHYVEKTRIYVTCHVCGKRMRTRPAVKDRAMVQDQYGNYFVAGLFKRIDEKEAEKLYSV